MATARRLLILHDSPDFGGHERAFLQFFPRLLQSPQLAAVTFCHYRGNEALAAQLKGFDSGKLRVATMPCRKNRGEPYLSPLRLGYRRFVREIARDSGADLALLLQGRIENLLVPLQSLSGRLPVVSYLPMAHAVSDMKVSGSLAGVGDRVRRQYYGLPRRFIVPSRAVARQLQRAGARGDVRVVENPVPRIAATTREQARRELGLPTDRRIALFLGRFDVHQKGLDLLAADLAASRDMDDWWFLFVGQGPGRGLIENCLRSGNVAGQIIDWTARPALMLAAADILLLPSRFEGVPLVMLEAFGCGLPILASQIDVFQDYLPAANLMTFGRGSALRPVLERLTDAGAVQRYRAAMNPTVERLGNSDAAARFEEALLAPLPPDRAGIRADTAASAAPLA
jgi:glycosyltransferase involved in cell wall biosynthesis